MDGLDTTDFERAEVNAEYKAERGLKRGKSGLSVNDHIRKKTVMRLRLCMKLLLSCWKMPVTR